MGIRDLRHAEVNELYWQFVRAETDSDRYCGRYTVHLTSSLLKKVNGNLLTSMNGAEWDQLRAAVLAVRGGYVEHVVSLGTSWYVGGLPLPQLADVRVIGGYDPFLALAHDRKLETFVQALDDGGIPPGDDGFAINYRNLRKKFDLRCMRGLPILLSTGPSGPFTEMEGLTRMSVLLSKYIRHEEVPEVIDVMLGTSNRIFEWKFY